MPLCKSMVHRNLQHAVLFAPSQTSILQLDQFQRRAAKIVRGLLIMSQSWFSLKQSLCLALLAVEKMGPERSLQAQKPEGKQTNGCCMPHLVVLALTT